MKWRLQYCTWSQSAAGRRTPMHNIGAVMADALLKDTMLFALISLYFFRFTFTAVIPYSDQKANRLCQERKFPGTFIPSSESARELSFLGAMVPSGNFRSEERKVLTPCQAPLNLHTSTCVPIYVQIADTSMQGRWGKKSCYPCNHNL